MERLSGALKAYQMEVWWDDSLAGGQQFRSRIKEELRGAKAVIVVWTKRSVESDWVLDEADDAKGRGKLLPVRFGGDFEIPFGFRQLQVVDFSKWSGAPDDALFKQVVEQVEFIGAQKFSLVSQALGVGLAEQARSGVRVGNAMFRSLADATFLGLPLQRFLGRGLLVGALLTAMIAFMFYPPGALPLADHILSDAGIAFGFFFLVRGVHQYVMFRKGASSRRVFDPPFRFWIWLSTMVTVMYIAITVDVLNAAAMMQAFPLTFMGAMVAIMLVRLVVSWLTPRAREQAFQPIE